MWMRMVSARMMGARKKVATARRRSMWVRRPRRASVYVGYMGGGFWIFNFEFLILNF